MKCLVLGAGRMGVRHAQGLLGCEAVTSVQISDIQFEALDRARQQLEAHPGFSKCTFQQAAEGLSAASAVDLAIVATTAGDRLGSLHKVYALGPKVVLLEKPLGQSYQEVTSLCDLVKSQSIKTLANLNMRLYSYFNALKNDFNSVPQLAGPKTITINSGAIGIGANGIHYIDLLIFLLGAAHVTIERSFVEDELIPSGRGPQFADFGGYACFAFHSAAGDVLGRAFVGINGQSSVVGAWEVVATHGRVRIDELMQKRYNRYRRADSPLPAYRYGADYLEEEAVDIQVPQLADLTQQWLEAYVRGDDLLPTVQDSLLAHQLMFNWLAGSSKFSDTFPIT